MTRQIKFRGKRLKDGEWIYGDLVENQGRFFIYHAASETTIEDNDDCKIAVSAVEVNPATVGQFTGLLDSNGKEIYEGDIITVKGRYPRVVLWDKMMWALMPTEYYHDEVFWVMNLQHPGVDWWEEFADEFEIIGNIHDNPSLISDKP